MTRRNSTPPPRPNKPPKPTPDFPLYAHASGLWAKKIRGRVHYFGKWADPDGALAAYNAKKNDLHAGRLPREVEATDGTVFQVCGAFLTAKKRQMEARELSPRSYRDYADVCKLLVKSLGRNRLVSDLRPDDFAKLRAGIVKKWGPVRVGNVIQRIRTVFRYAYEVRIVKEPVWFGPEFRRPSKKTLRRERHKHGPKLFTAEEIRRLLDIASPPMRAMILLGINCGFGNSDCGNLPLKALDLDAGWVTYPRPKTEVPRRCWLWPETVQAIRDALAVRPEPKDPDHAGLVFLTKYGESWAKDIADSPISKEMAKLLKRLGIDGHRNFYTCRHTHRTVADESRDQAACDAIMGHESPHMSSVYREKISDDRLRAVAEHVRAWLFAPPPADEGGEPEVLPFVRKQA